jgi:hypothetical protein
MAIPALTIYPSQGTQVTVSADVLSEHCQRYDDELAHVHQTLCNAAVQFVSVTGRVITTTVSDADPSDFRGTGDSRKVVLRYHPDDPAEPFPQGSYMPFGLFLLLLVAGCAALLSGGWVLARLDRLAARSQERAQVPRYSAVITLHGSTRK